MSLASHLRACVRLSVIVVLGLFCTAGLIVAGIILAPWQRVRQVATQGLLDLATWTMARTAGMRARIEGQAPSPPFFLVANHLGYMDILLIRLSCRAQFVSKAEIARWPIFGWIARLGGTVFVDRRNKRALDGTNRRIQASLQSGLGIAIFPEGTSSAGARIGRFYSSLLSYPASMGMPVHGATLYYATPVKPEAAWSVCWWGEMTFLDHLYRLLGMPHFDARIRFLARPLASHDRKQLALGLQDALSNSFDPIPGAIAT